MFSFMQRFMKCNGIMFVTFGNTPINYACISANVGRKAPKERTKEKEQAADTNAFLLV